MVADEIKRLTIDGCLKAHQDWAQATRNRYNNVFGKTFKIALANGKVSDNPALLNHIPRYMVDNGTMRIGELARQVGVNIQTLRFYEREGLLRAPLRSSAGYRSYEVTDLERVRFIRNCQGLGFTLREVQQLIRLHTGLSIPRREVAMKPSGVREIVDLAKERLTVVNEKIVALDSMRAELTALIDTLTNTSPAICPASRPKFGKQKTQKTLDSIPK